MKPNELERPFIEIYYVQASNIEQKLKKISEGIEEEGIPYRFKVLEQEMDYVRLSYQAARTSLLETGIGIDKNGSMALHYVKLPDDEPLFELCQPYSDADLRRFGSHAARLVKSLPFRLENE